MNKNLFKKFNKLSPSKTSSEIDDIIGQSLGLPPLNTKNEYKMFTSKYHVLYIEKDKSESEKISIPFDKLSTILDEEHKVHFEDNKEGSIDLMSPSVEFNRYSLHIGDFMHFEEDLVPLNTILYEIGRANENDTLTVHITSHGGWIDEYVKIKTHIMSSFPGRITTIMDPIGYSAGAMLFLHGDQRIVYEDCAMMIHTYAGGERGIGNRMYDGIVHSEKRFINLFKRELVDTGYVTPEEFEIFKIGKEFWLTFEQIIERKIATHIYLDGMLLSIDEYKDLIEMSKEDLESIDKELAKIESAPKPEPKKTTIKKGTKKPTAKVEDNITTEPIVKPTKKK